MFGRPKDSIIRVQLIDGSTVDLLVCRVPDSMLRQLMAVGDSWVAIMGLCCFVRSEFVSDQIDEVRSPLPVPDGYSRMPKHWPDNLTDESATRIWPVIENLNCARVAALADQLLQRAIEEGRLQGDDLVTPAQVAAL